MERATRGRGDVATVLDGVDRVWTGICIAVVVVLVGLRGLYSSYRVGGWLLLLAALVASALAFVLLLPAAVRRRWTPTARAVLAVYGTALVVVVGTDLLTN